MNNLVWFPLFIYRQEAAQIGGAFQGTTQQFQEALNQISWTPERIQGLQQAAQSGPQYTFCNANDSVSDKVAIESMQCCLYPHKF